MSRPRGSKNKPTGKLTGKQQWARDERYAAMCQAIYGRPRVPLTAEGKEILTPELASWLLNQHWARRVP